MNAWQWIEAAVGILLLAALFTYFQHDIKAWHSRRRQYFKFPQARFHLSSPVIEIVIILALAIDLAFLLRGGCESDMPRIEPAPAPVTSAAHHRHKSLQEAIADGHMIHGRRLRPRPAGAGALRGRTVPRLPAAESTLPVCADHVILGDSSWLYVGEVGVRASLEIVWYEGRIALSWLCPYADSAIVPPGADSCDYAFVYDDSLVASLVDVCVMTYKDTLDLTDKYDFALGQTYQLPGTDTACILWMRRLSLDGVVPATADEYYQVIFLDTVFARLVANVGDTVKGLLLLRADPYGVFPDQNPYNNLTVAPFATDGRSVWIDWSAATPPEVPTGLIASRTGKYLTFMWNATARTVSYQVEVNTGKGPQILSASSALLSTSIPQRKGTTARVRSVNSFGPSPWSQTITVK